jgi:hypothetical protein
MNNSEMMRYKIYEWINITSIKVYRNERKPDGLKKCGLLYSNYELSWFYIICP